ncbi:hypothetical protein EG329_012512 [Mollisiaceae sp. DMI_Dod_QoI]|nr:hypothetical protein EG329_012512 [Helotiales sp. DMI_Dod_QoI]
MRTATQISTRQLLSTTSKRASHNSSVRYSSALAFKMSSTPQFSSPASPQRTRNNSAPPDTSHSLEVRKQLRTHGLLPPSIESHALQTQRCKSLYISWHDRGNIINVLRNWPKPKVEITVVTDGSRILGLGDLGVNGMGIPIGKLTLYTGCAGIRPENTLPLCLDLGTNNEAYLKDPLYLGNRMRKVSDAEEKEFLDELMVALNTIWPGIVVQFEDFKNPFPALERYQHEFSCFNDDIQGTGAVILAGIINALKKTGKPVKDQRAVFIGAGSAGVGVAKQIVEFFKKEGLTEDEARRLFWFVDTKGLITNDRGDRLQPHKVYFSRDDNNGQQFKTLDQVVDYVQPTMLLGLSTIRGVFNESILKKMAQMNDEPIIFPLSNPSNNAECTFEEAIKHTEGRAIFASGSPFPPFLYNGKILQPSQGNNVYVFPGIGLGAILSKAIHISQEMIYASAVALSEATNATEINDSKLYPDLERIREVSVIVCREVIKEAQRQGLDREASIRGLSDANLDTWIRSKMYDPYKETGVDEEILSERSRASPMQKSLL